MTSRRLTYDDITTQLADLPDWAFTGPALHARHDAPDVATATRIIAEVFEVAEEMNHHPDVDLRWKRLRWQLATHDSGGVTQLDVELAHRISTIAGAAGAAVMDPHPVDIEIGVDTADIERIAPFWTAALGVSLTRQGEDLWIGDPGGLGPRIWFQLTDSPAPGRNRLHLDVTVGAAEVPLRRAAVEAAGGRLLSEDEFAPRWWVYADADGNEICICSPEGRE